MSMASYEPDRDYGDENAYEHHRESIAALGLCSRCQEHEALSDHDWCGPCVLEVETRLAEIEEAA